MRIGILGPLRVPGTEIGGVRLRALLIRLALDPGYVITAERLIDDLWADDPPVHPANALQSLVSRLRRELPGVIVSHPVGYLLDLPREEIDAGAFERLAGAGLAAADDPVRAAALLREALSLWRGPALADASGLAFAAAPAAHLEELRLSALRARFDADLALAGGPDAGPLPSELVAELEEVVTAHPLREPFHAHLVLALLADGRRADALRAFERIRRRLADRLGVDPGPELRDAHLTALRAGPSPVAAPRGNLPARLTSFVGRQPDLARLRELLGTARLVTLTGPGGAGKTRLAVETAAALHAPDGVWLVELASLSHPSGVAAAVHAALEGSGLLDGHPGPSWAGAEPAGRRGESLLERLTVALHGRSPLLVLDNCEHVIDEAARVADRLLTAAGGLRILATSREPLDITGESLHPVLPLGLPASDAGVEAALACPAVALFDDRAAAARPGTHVDGETVTDVVRVCRELDGIPLAIELAAARLRSLTVGQLADMIGDRLALRGSRTAQPRHRTLRAVIDWSWDLLDAGERTLLRRMSVFSGGATAETVRRVCGQDVDTIASLVDKSLVVVSPRTGADGGEVRYRLLETLRQYAAERLAEADETDRVRASHAHHFLELAETAGPALRTGDQVRALALFDAEQGNLDAALDHAISSGDGDLALRMILVRLWPWVMRGRRREAGEWVSAVLAAVGDGPPEGRELAHALCVLTAPVEAGTTRVTPAMLRRALQVVRESDHPAALGSWAIVSGHPGQAEDAYGRTLAMTERFRDHRDPWTRATALLMGGIVEFEYGRAGASRAEALLRPALEGYLLTGDRWGLSLTLYWLSLVAENRGDSGEALSLLERSVVPTTEIGGLEAIPGPIMLRVRLGRLRALTGDPSGAEAELERADAAVARTGDVIAIARVRHARGELARWRGDLVEAETLLRETLELVRGQVMASPQLVALVNVELARVLRLRGEPDRARSPLRRALGSIAASGDETVRATVLEEAAAWHASAAATGAAGDMERAAVLIGAAHALRAIARTADPAVGSLIIRAVGTLGEHGYRAARRRGAALPSPEAFALEGIGPPSP
ncbi:BTAD domain-containing putative transcriptional regulator [Streptosporangium sp. NBC_01756]|uniref:BTAD domain-containing putative transcriptional regulator n=1 Tax=Streptosporangium sp. NBC_01756 TaxID=2975950 RepID=UPI002DD87540|nr:BTAD domain-containing putative transcriptional regulator [Streptosporangium sp. NBC_01756]WSC89547.1 AAA family ATPase [Streptosporangium sp. NBC_01756]